jgi:D-glycero-alpha-D-manno-heptose-7-phosphate kinase
MIISRTPFRISFFGGGTDFPYWYNDYTGKVLSTTFDKYCYVNLRNLPPFFKYNYKLRYFKTEEVKNINQIVHPSIREILKFKNIKKNVEIVHQADLPAQSGLGASSSFSVGLIHCIAALNGQMISKRNLADQSLHIEQNILKEHVGSQDQIAAAFGGFNIINFKKNFYEVNSVVNTENIKKLEKNIVLVFSGTSREAQILEKEKKRNFYKNINYLKKINEITFKAEEKISSSKDILSDFSELMDEYWWLKKKLAYNVTNSKIDKIFSLAKKLGAESGKLLGAGGGGFFLFIVKEKKQKEFIEKLKKFVILLPRFENLGSQVIYYQK